MYDHDIIVRPVISEKSYNLADIGQYTFIVNKNANKSEIKIAVQNIFDVKVTNVNTINRKGKNMRTRLGKGKRNDLKRAIVTVAEGETISVFGA